MDILTYIDETQELELQFVQNKNELLCTLEPHFDQLLPAVSRYTTIISSLTKYPEAASTMEIVKILSDDTWEDEAKNGLTVPDHTDLVVTLEGFKERIGQLWEMVRRAIAYLRKLMGNIYQSILALLLNYQQVAERLSMAIRKANVTDAMIANKEISTISYRDWDGIRDTLHLLLTKVDQAVRDIKTINDQKDLAPLGKNISSLADALGLRLTYRDRCWYVDEQPGLDGKPITCEQLNIKDAGWQVSHFHNTREINNLIGMTRSKLHDTVRDLDRETQDLGKKLARELNANKGTSAEFDRLKVKVDLQLTFVRFLGKMCAYHATRSRFLIQQWIKVARAVYTCRA